jgi:hypothetical protein
MEAITRLVADSLARHGLDRPIDPRRLQWSRWSRCDSPHSLLVVPSKPGIFALAEEIMDLGNVHGGTDALVSLPRAESRGPAEQSSAEVVWDRVSDLVRPSEARLDFAASTTAPAPRRMLAVLQFSEDDDMAFTLDRMFTQINPMRARLSSGRCFLRFVVIEDQNQRRNICSALNQWLLNSAEKATGLPTDFQSSLELTSDRVGVGDSPKDAGTSTARVGRTLLSDSAESIPKPAQAQQPSLKPDSIHPALNPDSGANKNLHCPHPLPSGF